MRGTIITPLILIAIGGLLLLNNLNPEISIWSLIVRYWPYLLIIWGALRAAEILIQFTRQKPLPTRGISGGEWALIVFFTLSGSAFLFGTDMRDRIRSGRLGMRGLQIFGESYDYPFSGNLDAPANARIIVENRRGNVRIVGSETNKINVSGHYSIRALDRPAADLIHKRMNLELSNQGAQFVIRTNQEKADLDSSVDADMEIQVPKGVSVECRGVYGDFDVSQIAGDLEVKSDNAGVRGQDIGGKARIDLNRSDIIRLVRVKGSVDLKGRRAGDVELDEISGPVTVDGAFDDLDFRRLVAGLRFTSNQTDLQVDKILGRLHTSGGEMDGDDLSGTFRLRSKSKDLRLSNFDGPLDIDLNRGDIELAPGRPAFAMMNAKTSGGEVTLHLPENAKYDLLARTEKGEVENDFGVPLRREEYDRGGSISGSNGGPKLLLETRRGAIRVQRGGMLSSSRPDRVSTLPPVPPVPPAPKVPKIPGVVEQ